MLNCNFSKFVAIKNVLINISIISVTFRHGCSHVKMLHIFRTPFPKNTSGGLLLHLYGKITTSQEKYRKNNNIVD